MLQKSQRSTLNDEYYLMMVNENYFLINCPNVNFRFNITWNYFMKYSLFLCSPDNTPNRKLPVYLLFLG